MKQALLLLLALLLCGCAGSGASGSGAGSPPAGAQRAEAQGAAQIRLAFVDGRTGNPPRPLRPLYSSVESDRQALGRLVAMVQAVQWLPDPQVHRFPIEVPGGVGPVLHIVYTDAISVVVEQAFRCGGSGEDPSQCKLETNWVLVDGRPGFSPALARYLSNGYQADMPPVRADPG